MENLELLRTVTVKLFYDHTKPGWVSEVEVVKHSQENCEVTEAITDEIRFMVRNALAYYEGR